MSGNGSGSGSISSPSSLDGAFSDRNSIVYAPNSSQQSVSAPDERPEETRGHTHDGEEAKAVEAGQPEHRPRAPRLSKQMRSSS